MDTRHLVTTRDMIFHTKVKICSTRGKRGQGLALRVIGLGKGWEQGMGSDYLKISIKVYGCFNSEFLIDHKMFRKACFTIVSQDVTIGGKWVRGICIISYKCIYNDLTQKGTYKQGVIVMEEKWKRQKNTLYFHLNLMAP